jgi:hypothetical protein
MVGPEGYHLFMALHIITDHIGKTTASCLESLNFSAARNNIWAFLYECDGRSLRNKLPEPAVLKRLRCPKNIPVVPICFYIVGLLLQNLLKRHTPHRATAHSCPDVPLESLAVRP